MTLTPALLTSRMLYKLYPLGRLPIFWLLTLQKTEFLLTGLPFYHSTTHGYKKTFAHIKGFVLLTATNTASSLNPDHPSYLQEWDWPMQVKVFVLSE